MKSLLLPDGGPSVGRNRSRAWLTRAAARSRGAALLATMVSLPAVFASGSASAANVDEMTVRAQNAISDADRQAPTIQASVNSARSQLLGPEQRLANGEILYRMKDYPRASVVLSEIVEGYPNTPSYPDAMWLRGETYFAGHEYLSARRDYRALVDRGSEGRFAPYAGRALARLVDVSVRLGDTAALEDVYQRLQQVPPTQVNAGIQYARGKASYFKKDYSAAQSHFAAVPNGTPYTHQARYFQGLIAMKQARPSVAAAAPAASGTGGPEARPTPTNFKPAIEVFRQVTLLPADTPEHQHVIDLAWMAIGRLFYEMEAFSQASEAYSKVGRESPEFDTMLYELAWVYVRLGDVQRAERALEVLSIADPNSSFAGDGTLLRADLLLRAGAFDKALQLYTQVREEYDPMRVRVESFLESTKDPAVYYEKLSQQQLEALEITEQLPPIAIRWAREAEDGPAAFRVIDDVNQCKKLIADSERLVEKLVTLTNSANRVRAFPELLAGEQRALGLVNQIAHARVELAKALDEEEPNELSGEIGTVRSQRRQLMGVVNETPVKQADFDDRDYQGTFQWNTVSQELSRRVLEIDYLNAVINGLRRMLREDAERGVARDPSSVQRFGTELAENERLLKLYQEQAAEVRRQIEIGRAQIGLGDARYQNDAVARVQFRDLLERETQLAASGQAGNSAQRYAQRISPVLANARNAEERLIAAFNQLEAQVAQRIVELQGKIDAEAQKLAGYKVQLGELDGEARDLVGHVAERNYTLVRDKIRGIVLRADVGITEQAWEVREEELERVRNLQHERAREEQLLDEELREVLDDAGDPPK